MQTFTRPTITQTWALVAAGAALLALLVAPSAHAGGAFSEISHFTFRAPITLPGIVLPPGRYTFEVMGGASNVVRVSSDDGRRTRFSGFTAAIERPRRMRPEHVVTLGEAPRGEPRPIVAWFPGGNSSGHQFIYR